MDRFDVPGLVVLVLRRGEPAWRAAFGSADPDAGRPMTPDALFRVESLSKPVTAWGVMRLVERGIVALDDPVQDHLRTWFPPAGTPPITVAQLLSHTAGVGLGDFAARYPPEVPVPSLPESLDREFTRRGTPGLRFRYSDTGYNVLQVLVEDMTGEPFEAFMRAEILDPLGMDGATYRWSAEAGRRLAVGHDLRGRPVHPYVYPGQASGGLLATADDIGRFAGAEIARSGCAGNTLLTSASVAALHAERIQVDGLYGVVTDGYGLGHFTERLSDGRDAVWHGGQGYGWMTHLHMVPSTGDAIVLLANSQRAWPLFAHILKAWSGSLGVEPVGMARITWAAPLARAAIVLQLLGAAILIGRWRGPSRGVRSGSGIRVLRGVAGAGLVLTVVWCATRDYLFIFSVLPDMAGWLGVAAATLGLALLVPLAMPLRHPSEKGVALALAALGLGASPIAGQQDILSVEAGVFPSSPVAHALSGPFEEATVTVVRAALVLPATYRRSDLFVAARIAGSQTAIEPRPLDPTQPLWVEALYDLDLQVIVARRLTDRWWLEGMVAPGLASDGRNVDAEHLTIQGMLMGRRSWEDGLSVGAGASISNSFGETRFLPLGALEWSGGSATVDLLLPVRATVHWQLGDEVVAGLQAAVDGNVYALGREGVLDGGIVRYSVWEVGPRIQIAMGTRVRLEVRGGLSLRRRLEAEDVSGVVTEDAGLEDGASFTVALSVLPPTDGT